MNTKTDDTDYRSRLDKAFDHFDRANAEDPNRILVGGTSQAKELVYATRMTARLKHFAPDASETLKLAVRCQHIRRWTIPRSRFPAGRTGYRKWRKHLATFHADTAGDLLRQLDYDETIIQQVGRLLRKENLKSDAEVQTLEDVACLVFLEHYLAEFVTSHNETKLIDILRKTWRKMSSAGHSAAAELKLDSHLNSLVEKALSE